MKNKIYIIEGKTYLNHINDEVHLYGLLHQLAFLAGRIKDEEDVFHVLDTAKRYGEIAEEKFQGWGIPGRYLVFGDPKDLKDLMAKELAEATPVPVEEPKPKKYRDEYIIPGSGFRMLVGDIHNLIVLYYSLARRLSEAETEKDFLRLKKKAGGYEKVLKKLFRSLGLPEDSNAAQDSWRSPSSAAITWSAWRMWRSPRTRETLKGTRYGATDPCEPVLRHRRSGPGGGGGRVRDRLPV